MGTGLYMDQWQKFIKKQEAELGVEAVGKWLKPLKIIRFDARNLYLEASDAFAVLWFEEHIRDKVQHELFNNNNQRIKVHLSTVNGAPEVKKKRKTATAPSSVASNFQISFQDIDPICDFEHFIVEPGNRVAFETLSQINISNNTPIVFNPIYLYGKTGTGKSHLLMAAASSFRNKGLRVVYAHAQEFTNHVVLAIRAGEMNIFRQAYRNIDLLIIDDVHILSKKSATQEEFFHGFNALHITGKQIILSANCHPSELDMIEPRLISRFEWGIVLPLEAASRENRKKILLTRSEAIKFPLEEKLQDFLIETFSSTKSMIKALEILALRSHLSNEKNKGHPHLSLSSAKHLLHDFLVEDRAKSLTADHILRAVSEHFGIRVEDLLGKIQTKDHVFPRQVAMYLCRHSLMMPFAKIGHLFSKDHSTVMSSVKIIQKNIDAGNPEITSAYHTILKKFK